MTHIADDVKEMWYRMCEPPKGFDSLKVCAKYWDMMLPLPLPKKPITCPSCRSPHIQMRQWSFHRRPSSTKSAHSYRCDASMKCRICSHAFTFGLIIPESMYSDAIVVKRIYHWREGWNLIQYHLANPTARIDYTRVEPVTDEEKRRIY